MYVHGISPVLRNIEDGKLMISKQSNPSNSRLYLYVVNFCKFHQLITFIYSSNLDMYTYQSLDL